MDTHFKTYIVMLTRDDRQHGHVVVVPVVVPSARSQKPQSNGAAREMRSREWRRLRLQYHDSPPRSTSRKVPVTIYDPTLRLVIINLQLLQPEMCVTKLNTNIFPLPCDQVGGGPESAGPINHLAHTTDQNMVNKGHAQGLV